MRHTLRSLKRRLPGFLLRVARRLRLSIPQQTLNSINLQHYIIRCRSLFDRSKDLQDRFGSYQTLAYERYADTEAVINIREIQESGVPFPHWQEMLNVGGETDLRIFLNVGYDCYQVIKRYMPDNLPQPAKVLDFGVGCARTMRFFFRDQDKFDCYGCDVDTQSIAYINKSIPFIKATVSNNLPPLPYGANYFDLIYCISVFTHFNARTFREWLDEMYRIIKPGGTFLITLHSEWALSLLETEPHRRVLIRLSEQEFANNRGAFDKEGYVWLSQPSESQDIDTSQFGIFFISKDFFTNLVQDKFELVEYAVGAISNWQDVVVLKKRDGLQ